MNLHPGRGVRRKSTGPVFKTGAGALHAVTQLFSCRRVGERSSQLDPTRRFDLDLPS
jgi:hypothetical protein